MQRLFKVMKWFDPPLHYSYAEVDCHGPLDAALAMTKKALRSVAQE